MHKHIEFSYNSLALMLASSVFVLILDGFKL